MRHNRGRRLLEFATSSLSPIRPAGHSRWLAVHANRRVTMRFNSLPIGLRLSAAVLLAAAGAGAAWASPTDPPNPLTKRFVQGKALDVCDFGALFIGGVPKVTNYLNSATSAGAPDQTIIGKMYVQFQIPTKRRKWPLVMVHGSGYTGSALDATPDGREGWFPYAVQNNLA